MAFSALYYTTINNEMVMVMVMVIKHCPFFSSFLCQVLDLIPKKKNVVTQIWEKKWTYVWEICVIILVTPHNRQLGRYKLPGNRLPVLYLNSDEKRATSFILRKGATLYSDGCSIVDNIFQRRTLGMLLTKKIVTYYCAP